MKYLLIDDKLSIVPDDFHLDYFKESHLFLSWKLQVGKIDRITIFSKKEKSKLLFYRDDSQKTRNELSGNWEIDKHVYDPYGTIKTYIRDGRTKYVSITEPEYSNMVSRWCDENDEFYPYSDKEVEIIIINCRKKKVLVCLQLAQLLIAGHLCLFRLNLNIKLNKIK